MKHLLLETNPNKLPHDSKEMRVILYLQPFKMTVETLLIRLYFHLMSLWYYNSISLDDLWHLSSFEFFVVHLLIICGMFLCILAKYYVVQDFTFITFYSPCKSNLKHPHVLSSEILNYIIRFSFLDLFIHGRLFYWCKKNLIAFFFIINYMISFHTLTHLIDTIWVLVCHLTLELHFNLMYTILGETWS